MHYYQRDLALIHDRGYGGYADHCAPGILELLAPVRELPGGLVLEVGCGSGALTRHLLAAGLRVVATDASPDMLSLARDALGGSVDLRPLALPGDPLPAADAVVSTGHALSYLPDAAAIEAALIAAADALRPGGVLAVDILDLDYGSIRAGEPPVARVAEDWVIVTEFSAPAPDRFVREATTFVPDGAGAWRRGHERHENVLIDTSRLPGLVAAHGVRAEVGTAFGAAELPPGLRSVTGRKDLYRTGWVRRHPQALSLNNHIRPTESDSFPFTRGGRLRGTREATTSPCRHRTGGLEPSQWDNATVRTGSPGRGLPGPGAARAGGGPGRGRGGGWR